MEDVDRSSEGKEEARGPEGKRRIFLKVYRVAELTDEIGGWKLEDGTEEWKLIRFLSSDPWIPRKIKADWKIIEQIFSEFIVEK